MTEGWITEVFKLLDTAQYPALLAMLLVIILLFRQANARTKTFNEIVKTLEKNTHSLNKMTTLLEVLIYGSRKARLIHDDEDKGVD